jgi:hypothetical protein
MPSSHLADLPLPLLSSPRSLYYIMSSSINIPLQEIQGSASRWSAYSPQPPLMNLQDQLYYQLSHNPLEQLYAIGDPIYVDDAPEPSIFLGIMNNRCDKEGRDQYEAEFRAPITTFPPLSICLLLLHHIHWDHIQLPPQSQYMNWFTEWIHKYYCL